MVWAEVVEGARENARLPVRYVVYMAVAGVLAAFAVVLENPVLLVGAMAVSPDLLPVTAACVGIVGRRPRLAGRSLGTLALGLTVSILTAFADHPLPRRRRLSHGRSLSPRGRRSSFPTGIDLSTVIVAFVAGIAGMIATETQGEHGRRRGDLGDDDPRGRLYGCSDRRWASMASRSRDSRCSV